MAPTIVRLSLEIIDNLSSKEREGLSYDASHTCITHAQGPMKDPVLAMALK